MKKILTVLFSLFVLAAMSQNITQPYWFNNQVSIGNSVADQCAILGINSSTKGFLLPRMLAGDRNAIRNPSKGLMVYQTDGTAGIYYNAGTPTSKNWVKLAGGSVTGTPTRIPYFNSVGNLTSDDGMWRDSANYYETGILSTKGDTMVSLVIIPAYGAVAMTAEDTVAAKSSVIAALVESISMVCESPDADTRIDMGDYSMAISATSALANLQQSRIIIDTTQITFVSGEKFGFQNNYSFPTDTGSVGQVLGVATNDGAGINTLSWQSITTETTWSPTVTLVGGAGNTVPVYITNNARYERVGNLIFCSVELEGDGGNEGAGTGQINVALPIVAGANQFHIEYPCGRSINGAVEFILFGTINAASTTISISQQSAANSTTSLIGVEQNNTTRHIDLQFWYRVD
jgi:hypothetical protein